MKVSIIVSILNMEKYLIDSINSILENCGVEDYECILVDGNSNDNSKSICLDYQKKYKHITYIRLNTSEYTDVCNAGLKYASGEYVYFINGSDLLSKDFIKDGVTYLDNNKIDIFIRNCKTKNENRIEKFNNAFLQTKLGPYLSMCIFRKSIINIYFSDYFCSEIIFSGKLVWLNESFHFESNNFNSFIKNTQYSWPFFDYVSAFSLKWDLYVKERIQEYISRKTNVSYHVIDKCNKNCIACGHFSPLVPDTDEGVDVKTFEADLKSIQFLKPNISKFILTGGEPTLHKNLIELLKISLKYFDNIRLCSNGLNVDFFEQNKDFINSNNIEVYITEYNENNSNKIRNIIKNTNGYHINLLEDEKNKRIKFYCKHLSSKPVNENKQYNCQRGECVQLKHKKLYLCQYTANFEFLKNYFNTIDFPFTEENTYIDLTECKGAEEVLNFIYNSWPNMCNYCNEVFNTHGVDPKRIVELTSSKKQLDEFYE